MHGSRALAETLIQEVAQGSKELTKVEIVVGPTLLHLGLAAEICNSQQHVKLAAQNCSNETEGAFTGEVAAPMLAEYGGELCPNRTFGKTRNLR